MQHDDSLQEPPDPPSATRLKLQNLKNTAKEKTKRALKIESLEEEDGTKTPYEAAVEELDNSPAFNSDKFLNRARIGPAGLPDKVIAAVQGTANVIISPKTAIKTRATRKAAGKLAKSRPYLSRKADLDFLEAHDDLHRLEGERSGGNDEETGARIDEDVNQVEDRINDMELTRQSMRVAWVTARHVQRVRVVDAIPPPPFPDIKFFEKPDACGYPEFQWGRWIAYKLLSSTHNYTAQYIDDFDELPFDFDTLRRHIERLIIVSAPLQTFISNIRAIYRWEDPARTSTWMMLYFFLWYISHIMTFVWAYTLYSAILNYLYPSSLEELRQAIERTIDRGATAFKIGEMMDKHGSDDWLEPFLQELGPFIQIQVADFANFLESTYNCFHWRSPRATISTLALFAALFLITALTDSRFSMKVFWLVVGVTFFICWPISSLHPRYRLLVSPFKWAFWDVPTHSEWCFQYLQERGAIARDAILSKVNDDDYVLLGDPATPHIFINDDAESDNDFEEAREFQIDREREILSFGCTYLHVPGRFIISSTTVRFEATAIAGILPYESFIKPYTSLIEMSKRQTRSSILSPLAKVTTGMDKLELKFRDENRGARMHGVRDKEGAEVVTLQNMRGRDKAFNAVVAFSGLKWQSLQKKPDRAKKPVT